MCRRSPYEFDGWASPCDDLKTLLSTEQLMGTFFELGKDNAAKGERWDPPFISSAQDTMGL